MIAALEIHDLYKFVSNLMIMSSSRIWEWSKERLELQQNQEDVAICEKACNM